MKTSFLYCVFWHFRIKYLEERDYEKAQRDVEVREIAILLVESYTFWLLTI